MFGLDFHFMDQLFSPPLSVMTIKRTINHNFKQQKKNREGFK
jgi:hypothetical protein